MINHNLEIGMIVVDYNHPDETLDFVNLLIKQKIKKILQSLSLRMDQIKIP